MSAGRPDQPTELQLRRWRRKWRDRYQSQKRRARGIDRLRRAYRRKSQ